MRKLIIITLILSFVLSGRTTPDPDYNTTNTLDSHLSEVSKDWTSQTDPAVPLEDETSGPVTSDPTETTPTVPDSTENSTEVTEPARSTEDAAPLKHNLPSRQQKNQLLHQLHLRKQNRNPPLHRRQLRHSHQKHNLRRLHLKRLPRPQLSRRSSSRRSLRIPMSSNGRSHSILHST